MDKSRSLATIAIALLILLITGGISLAQSPPEIPFAPTTDSSLKDPDNPTKVFRVDFARVEHQFPLSRADLMKITPENLAKLSQEQVDQIYGRITSGPVPDGQYRVNVFFARGETMRTRLEEILGGLTGRLAAINIPLLEEQIRALWKGKDFQRGQRISRNMIESPSILRDIVDLLASVRALIDKFSGLQGVADKFVPGDLIRDRAFPAKVYCGQSLLDARRESIVVDFNYSDEIEGYRENPDWLAGRNGLRIREEIRMVRPGFYLGRLHANRVFLLNFTLFNAEVAERESVAFADDAVLNEECWPGEQAVR